ncbi:MAG: hypothetical protein JJU00_05495 [Opitutales bacterium]|nr:hypothetical protein [Opitutales bacterium]
MKFRDPIIIYDSKARKALDTPVNDLEAFYKEWEIEYEKIEDRIVRVSRRLARFHRFLAMNDTVNKAEVDEVTGSRWFHRRVFDVYLWFKGNSSNK